MFARTLTLLALLSGIIGTARAEPFRFVAFGDMPYCTPNRPEACPQEEGRVARLVRGINAERPAFSIFVGDTKGGSEICSDDKLLRAFTWMNLADHPLVYTPGDNEWTDCWQSRAGRFDPLERLALLRARFFPDAQSLGRRPMALLRQADLDPAQPSFVENARWVHQGVVFLTLHVTGSNNNRPTEPDEMPPSRPPAGAIAEFEARDAANRAWLRTAFNEARSMNARAIVIAQQADMYYADRCGGGQRSGFLALRAVLEAEALAFGRPVLLIYGDNHTFLQETHGPGIPNLMRVMVPGGSDVRAVVVEADPEAREAWRFRLIGSADGAANKPC
ncbi:MAG: hypothetical protein RIS83_1511 [Pseudomonadota bacterium]|jgi:hypothetical protein